MICEVRPHPHGGFTIARQCAPGSTARVYHGQFPSELAAAQSPLFRQLETEKTALSPDQHKAKAMELLALSARMADRAEAHRARSNMESTHERWSRWFVRAARAHKAAIRLIRWADAAQFEAMKSRLA